MTDYVEFVRVDGTVKVQVAAATNLVAGEWIVYSTGAAKNTTNGAINVLGVALHNANNTSGAIGDLEVTVVTSGLIKAPAVVETAATDAFDATIAIGDRLSLGGDAGGNVADGQGLVDGINASGSDQDTFAEGLVVAIALGAVGAATYDSDLEALLTIN